MFDFNTQVTTFVAMKNLLTTLIVISTFQAFSQRPQTNLESDNVSSAESLQKLKWGTDSTFEVITWNIERFPKNGQTTIDSVGKIMSALNVDLWALQEIDDSNKLKQAIARLPDYKTAFGTGYFAGLAYVYNSKTLENVKISSLFTERQYWNPLPRAPLVLSFTYKDSSIKVINNHYKCCGNGTWDKSNPNDQESRRYKGHRLIMDYVDSLWKDERVMVVGDLNDILTDGRSNNIFQKELDDTSNYRFVDLSVAKDASKNWSYPTWPSHLDHILINQALIEQFKQSTTEVSCIQVDQNLPNKWSDYDRMISDHRPVGFKFEFLMNQTPKDTTIKDTTNSISVEFKVLIYSIYPNPTKSLLNIKLQGKQGVTKVEIRDVLGKIIVQKNTSENTTDIEWNFDLLFSGTYFVQFWENDNLLKTEKVIRTE